MTPKMRRPMIATLVALAAGCGSRAGNDPFLLDSEEEEVVTGDAELERLRKMMAIRVIDEQGGIAEDSNSVWHGYLTETCGDYHSCGMPELNESATATCESTAPSAACDSCCVGEGAEHGTLYVGDEPSCKCYGGYTKEWALCQTAAFLCWADFYLAAAELVAEPIVFTIGEDNGYAPPGDWQLPPQSSATRAALYEFAAERYWSTLRDYASVLGGGMVNSYTFTTGDLLTEYNGQLVSKLSASNMVAAYQRGIRAYEGAVEQTLAAADAQWGSTPSTGLAAARVNSGQHLSRAAAAHLLVGGSEGLYGVTSRALCDVPPLSGEGRAALAILEEAAPHPAYAGSVGVIEARIERFRGVEFQTSLLDDTGLTEESFEEAEEYFLQVLYAFDRPTGWAFDDTDPLSRYAGYGEPEPLPDGYWATVARYNDGTTGHARGYPVEYGTFPDVSSEGMAGMIDFAHSAAAYLLGRHGETSPVHGPVQPLGLINSDRRRVARIVDCSVGSQSESYIRVNGVAAADGLNLVGPGMILVQHPNALRCATRGHVEGAPCSMEEFTSAAFTTSGFAEPGFDQSYYTGMAIFQGEKYFVLAPREEATEPEGGYRLIGGFTGVVWGDTHDWRCRDFPIVPEIEKRVGEILAPSREWCTEPEVSCAGGAFDVRMPLENELADDGDLVESSWKHHLAMAQQAASESDALANEYITASLSGDQYEDEIELRHRSQEEKAVAALQRVQAICGASVEPQSLLEALGGENLETVTTGECTETTQSTLCVKGFDEDTGIGITDWTATANSDPGMTQVRDCLNAFSEEQEPYVHFGDATLCLWETADGRCGGPGDRRRCPLLVENGVCPIPSDTTEVADPEEPSQPLRIRPSEGLQLFDTRSSISGTEPAELLADKVRRLRLHPSKAAAEIVNHEFQLNRLERLANLISIDIDYGGHVVLRIDDREWRTGYPETGPQSSKWPCANEGLPAACTDTERPGTGLFCTTDNCSATNRGLLADRWLRAVAAAKYLASGDAASVEIPLPHNVWGWVRKPGPDGGTLAVFNGDGVDTAFVTREVNDTWRGFVQPEGEDPGLYQTAFWLGTKTWLVDDAWMFAIRDLPGSRVGEPIELLDYWSGMTPTSSGYGLFRRLLDGTAQPNEGGAQGLRFGDSFTLNCECSYLFSCDYVEALLCTQVELPERGLEPGGGDRLVYESAELDVVLTDQVLLDALELLAEAHGSTDGGGECAGDPPEVRSADQLREAGAYLKCMGSLIQHRAGTAVFTQFPKAALDPLRRSGSNLYETVPGELGRAIRDLRTELIAMNDYGVSLGAELRQFGEDIRIFEETLRSYATDDEIAQVQLQSAIWSQATACVASASSVFTLGSFGGGAGAAQATCANSLAQIQFAQTLANLRNEQTQTAREIAASRFQQTFEDRIRALDAAESGLLVARENVAARLGAIQSLRQEAVRSVNDALWHMSFQAKNDAAIASVLASRSETARERYVRAHTNARRMAFLAKRAIEQRLGIRLRDMKDDLPLVEAPTTWESTICATSPLDYNEYRESDPDKPASFADRYIGEYVAKLENVVESYRLQHDFHEGSDTAVVSLRDDIMGVRAFCEQENTNKLVFASQLHRASLGPGERGWFADGCLLQEEDEEASNQPDGVPNCMSADPREGVVEPAQMYRLTFGDSNGCTDQSACGWQTGAALVQALPVEAGRYIFSWYGAGETGAAAARVQGLDSCELTAGLATDVTLLYSEVEGIPGWKRNYLALDVAESTTLSVGFGRPRCNGAHILVDEVEAWSADVGAPMLERVEGAPPDFRGGPRVFEDTTDTGTRLAHVCEDTNGHDFRTRWRPGGVKLCTDGYGDDCGNRLVKEVFNETDFYVNQRGLDTGRFFSQSGFARGNFNYRIEKIAVNFVGSGIRGCEDSNLPTTCYGSGFVPYTLIHDGPYYVRNHKGEDFEAKLFRGRIEHARGLAIERYVSNPIGNADQDLIEQYMRAEFRGRPLDGNFTLRVWDTDGVNFDAIEDVQLIIKYRYWTRFD